MARVFDVTQPDMKRRYTLPNENNKYRKVNNFVPNMTVNNLVNDMSNANFHFFAAEP